MWRSTEIRTVLALAGIVLATACLQPADANEVLKWNDTATKAATASGQNPIQTTRTIAMVQGAVHDALNAITPRYAAYYYEAAATAGASPDAAVAAAVLHGAGRRHPQLRRTASEERKPLLWSRRPTRRALGSSARRNRSDARCRGRHRRGRGDAGVAQGRWRDKGCAVYPLDRARPVAPAPESRSAQPADQGSEACAGPCRFDPPRMGQRHTLHVAFGLAVLAARSAGAEQRSLRARLQ